MEDDTPSNTPGDANRANAAGRRGKRCKTDVSGHLAWNPTVLRALAILFWILGLGPRSMSRFIGDTYLSQVHPQTTFRCVENRYDATLEVYTLRYQTGEKELTLHVQGKWFPNKVVFDSWAKEASEDNEETNK